MAKKNARRTTKTVAAFVATSFLDAYKAHSAEVNAALETQRVEQADADLESAELSALEAEILANESAAPSIIDHHSQMSSWSGAFETPETPEALNEADLAAISALEDAEQTEATIESLEPETPVIETIESAETDDAPASFAAQLAAISHEEAMSKAKAIGAQLDARADFQRKKNPENASIQKTLTSARKELATLRAARLLISTSVHESFINRELHDGSRYNVYAFGKLADLARALVDGVGLSNAINRAVIKSMFSCRKHGVGFTLEIAKAAASNKIRLDPSIASKLFRHTVSASTAPTQASSTMQALETLGIVKIEGSRRNPTYVIQNTPAALALEAAAAA